MNKIKNTTFIVMLSVFATFTSAAGNSNSIAPSSGKWQPKITSHKTSGCPSMMKAALNQAKMNTSTKTVEFSKPFHPNDLFDPKDINPEGSPDVKWVNSKPNYWEVTIINNQGGMEFGIKWKLKVTSKTTMDVISHISMKFPKEMASMMGSSECKVDSSGIIKRIAD